MNTTVKSSVLARNKNLLRYYRVIKTYTAGIVLEGCEIKSLRQKQVDISNAFVTFHNQVPQVINMHIKKYQYTSAWSDKTPEDRTRILLLRKNEILNLQLKKKQLNATIMVSKVFLSRNKYAKLEIALATRIRKEDKRELIKAKMAQEQMH